MRKRFRIIWVGKTKEPFVQEGIEKYLKLLSPLAEVEIKTIKEERGKGVKEALRREGKRICEMSEEYILLDEKGRMMNTMEFAGFISDRRDMDFVLGGPYGVDETVRQKASLILSLSPMTFPHDLVRLLLLEQLYRAVTILSGRRYHH